jgi:hypothetical protein
MYCCTSYYFYSLEQIPSWEANRFAASQKISLILWNPKVQYRIHKCPPPVSIRSQLDLVHNSKSYFLKIHLNIIFPSKSGSPQWSLSLRFPHQNPLHVFYLSNPTYMPCPSHYSRFYHPHYSGWGVQIMELLIMKFYVVNTHPVYCSLWHTILRSNKDVYLLHTTIQPNLLVFNN